MANGNPGNMPFSSPVSPTPSPQPRPPIKSTYIASGTEGCIVDPALPNLSENGSRWEEYPEYVTKLYKNDDKYIKAIDDATKIKAILGNNSHAVYPYRYKEGKPNHEIDIKKPHKI